MKKVVYFAMAALMFAACEKAGQDNGDNGNNGTGTGSGDDGNPVFVEGEGQFTYYGETYKTVTLKDGSVWMAEPLRYIPEGYTPSDDPINADAHIWYPYELTHTGDGVNDTESTALTDDESVRKIGYLYDVYAVFGVSEINDDNKKTFEGTQGICPKGWHIPTRIEMLSLAGYSNSTETLEKETDATALFYDKDYNGAKVSSFNDAGWNLVFSGSRAITTKEASYQKTIICEANSTVTDYFNNPAMTYIMSSSYSKMTSGNIMFSALMTTFNKAKYPEGRVTVAEANIASGMQVRCVKDKK